MTPQAAPQPKTEAELKLQKLRMFQESLVKTLRIKNRMKDSLTGSYKFTDESIETIADSMQLVLLKEEANSEPVTLRLNRLLAKLNDHTINSSESCELVEMVMDLQSILIYGPSEGEVS